MDRLEVVVWCGLHSTMYNNKSTPSTVISGSGSAQPRLTQERYPKDTIQHRGSTFNTTALTPSLGHGYES